MLSMKINKLRTLSTKNNQRCNSIEIPNFRRSKRKSGGEMKRICFVCNEMKEIDNVPYNSGGLGRCERDAAKNTLDNSFIDFEEGNKFHDAAQRLVVVRERSHDLFAADVYYHKQCYNQYVAEHRRLVNHRGSDFQMEKELEIDSKISEAFFNLFERKVITEKNAYLLTELLTDINEMSNDAGLTDPTIKQTSNLKKRLEQHFPGKIAFEKVNNKLIVYPIDVNPCFYVSKTLEGSGLRDEDLTRTFARMVHRKLLSKERRMMWPITAEQLLKGLESSGPYSLHLQCSFLECSSI